jgi:hypothetical protein
MNQSASLNAYDLNLSDALAKKVHDNPASACREAAHDRNRGKRVRLKPEMRAISHEQSLRSYFEFFDKDNSGTIEMREVKRFLPKLFMNNPGAIAEVEAAFRFVDKDNNGHVIFSEFAKSTIGASKPLNLADEILANHFDSEVFMFLGLALRSRLKADFQRDLQHKRDDPLMPYLQFQRLVRISQAAVMPTEMACAVVEAKQKMAEAQKEALLGKVPPSRKGAAAKEGESPEERSLRLRRRRSVIVERIQKRLGRGGGGGEGKPSSSSSSPTSEAEAAIAAVSTKLPAIVKGERDDDDYDKAPPAEAEEKQTKKATTVMRKSRGSRRRVW